VTPTSVAVFARAPVAGFAKTRLVPRLGRQGAARLQRLFTARAVRTAQDAAIGPVSLWCSPDSSHRAFAAIGRQSDVKLFSQRGADLGARMLAAFALLCRAGPALLIGTDCPALTAATVRDAAQALDVGHGAVLVPAEDGGYVLIGLRRAEPSLFDAIPWSTDRVMAETRARLHRSGLRWRELPASWDVDRPDDVDRLLASALMPELRVLEP
jgi:rSAM/selenodomain-associated transferase 1